ncbi:MAG TPA: hypothetical protein PK542_03425 [Treponemataceae bacterium]|nr:hypothetical protein [Treponemataceae bacterium]HPS43518.1 hypothetical protein [Treponemataceae bacterium]
MNKKLALSFALLVATAALFAAGAQDTVTAEGKLVVTDSIPMIQGNGKTWVLPAGPFYQLAWENGAKVGDTVKAEGFTRECPADFAIKGAEMLMPTKVWLNGKEIDLSTVRRPMMGFGMGRGNGRGWMDDGSGPRCGNRGRDYDSDDQGDRGRK